MQYGQMSFLCTLHRKLCHWPRFLCTVHRKFLPIFGKILNFKLEPRTKNLAHFNGSEFPHLVLYLICCLPDNILNKIANKTLIICKESNKSWFTQICSHCQLYGLPHLLFLLSRPLPKEQYNKKLVRLNIAQYWANRANYVMQPQNNFFFKIFSFIMF